MQEEVLENLTWENSKDLSKEECLEGFVNLNPLKEIRGCVLAGVGTMGGLVVGYFGSYLVEKYLITGYELCRIFEEFYK